MHVIVGVDCREQTMYTLSRAVDRARETGDDLTVAVYTTDDRAVEECVERVRDYLAERDFDASLTRIRADNPAPDLVELAERTSSDRLMITGGEQSPLGKIELDGVVEYVLLNAKTTVTLVR